jgi:hypothetical protein
LDEDDSHDEVNGFFLSDGGDNAMYGIRAPRRNAAREWRFDSLRISHLMDMNEMLQILEDIMSYMYSLLPYTLGLVAYLRRTGAAIQDKILFVIEAMAWLMCYAEMLILTIKDHLYFERFRNSHGHDEQHCRCHLVNYLCFCRVGVCAISHEQQQRQEAAFLADEHPTISR